MPNLYLNLVKQPESGLERLMPPHITVKSDREQLRARKSTRWIQMNWGTENGVNMASKALNGDLPFWMIEEYWTAKVVA